MEVYRGWRLSAKQLSAHMARLEIIGFKVGRSEHPRLLGLPYGKWAERVQHEYRVDVLECAKRVDTGTAADGGLSEGALLDVLTHQYDETGDIRYATLVVVTLDDGHGGNYDATIVVPANPKWLAIVGPGEGE
jgi:hypothetical protein